MGSYLESIQEMLDVLLANEDINIMSGDIIKAYGSDLYTLPYIQENELQEIVHDENLLLQFSNSTVLDMVGATITSGVVDTNTTLVRFSRYNASGMPETTTVPEIGQFNGSLVAHCSVDFKLTTNSNPISICNMGITMLDNFFLNTTNKDVTPENVLE